MPTILKRIMKEKFITHQQKKKIQSLCVHRQKPIQDLLIDEKFITEKEFYNLAAKVFSGAVIDQDDEIIDPDCIDLIPCHLAKRHGIFPIRKEKQKLLLAMSNPHDLIAIDDIHLITGLMIKPALCSKSRITSFIKEYYLKKESVTHLLKNIHVGSIAREDTAGFACDEENQDITETGQQDSHLLKLVNRIISDAVDVRASDVHIEPQEDGLCIRYRIDGYLKHVVDIPLSLLDRIIARVKILAKLDIAEKRKFQDGRIRVMVEGRKLDLRVSMVPVYHGEKAVIRILDTESTKFELNDIGLQPDEKAVFTEAINRPQGVVLLTGPTGSGKTTTIYSALQHIKNETRNIVTIEDPVEYLMEGINQLQLNRVKDITFANGLRSILRQDPDVILVGEIRDKETADMAFRSSITGHLVFSSLHTNNASSSIIRLMDIGLQPYLIASSVHLIVSQRLVRVICPHCKETYTPDKWLLDKFNFYLDRVFVGQFLRGKGCRRCDFTGYRERTSIFEMLNVNQKIKNLIYQKAPESMIFQEAVRSGMKPLAQSGVEKVAQGLTTLEEVATVADVEEMGQDVQISDFIYSHPLNQG